MRMGVSWCVAERRSKLRFLIPLKVRYAGNQPPLAGAGRTVNISSSGVLVATQRSISVGTQIELIADWPNSLNGAIPLRLVIFGEVVRSEAGMFAVSFKRHHFRTARKQPESVSGNEGYREVG